MDKAMMVNKLNWVLGSLDAMTTVLDIDANKTVRLALLSVSAMVEEVLGELEGKQEEAPPAPIEEEVKSKLTDKEKEDAIDRFCCGLECGNCPLHGRPDNPPSVDCCAQPHFFDALVKDGYLDKDGNILRHGMNK